MAKNESKPGIRLAAGALPGPEPQPKVGDTVAYLFHEHAGTKFQDKVFPARVTQVHDGHDGRLVNLAVETGDDFQRIGPVAYRQHDPDAPCGNSWHWPAASAVAPKEPPKTD